MSEDRNCVDCIFFDIFDDLDNVCCMFDDWNLTEKEMSSRAKQCPEYKEEATFEYETLIIEPKPSPFC